MSKLELMKEIILAPYILKATALIGVKRKVGGNQFRHSFNTLGILIDYKYETDGILLKAALLHDLLEELADQKLEEIISLDDNGIDVIKLVIEITRKYSETKEEYLNRLKFSSKRAKILKCADRISNLTDLHLDTHTSGKISEYLDQTEKYILPLAKDVNKDFVIEIKDLIKRRRKLC